MTQLPKQPEGFTPRPSSLDKLAVYRRPFAYSLSGGAFVIAIIALRIFIRYVWQGGNVGTNWPLLLWLIALVFTIALVAGRNFFYGDADTMTEVEKFRFNLMLLGGLVGLFTALLGILLPFTEFRETFAG